MIILANIAAFLATRLGQGLVLLAGAGALWLGFKTHYESKGATKFQTKVERANDKVIDRAHRVRTKSRSAGVRGAVDPNYIDQP